MSTAETTVLFANGKWRYYLSTITKHLLTLTPAGTESDLKRYGERHLARRKSPILTAQTTRPLQKKWPRDELW